MRLVPNRAKVNRCPVWRRLSKTSTTVLCTRENVCFTKKTRNLNVQIIRGTRRSRAIPVMPTDVTLRRRRSLLVVLEGGPRWMGALPTPPLEDPETFDLIMICDAFRLIYDADYTNDLTSLIINDFWLNNRLKNKNKYLLSLARLLCFQCSEWSLSNLKDVVSSVVQDASVFE
jgi:hypothetical protein